MLIKILQLFWNRYMHFHLPGESSDAYTYAMYLLYNWRHKVRMPVPMRSRSIPPDSSMKSTLQRPMTYSCYKVMPERSIRLSVEISMKQMHASSLLSNNLKKPSFFSPLLCNDSPCFGIHPKFIAGCLSILRSFLNAKSPYRY